MTWFPVRSLAPLAEKYDLGAVVSVHRLERRNIRMLCRLAWSLFAAVPAGVVPAYFAAVAYNYATGEMVGILALVAGLYGAGLVAAGPVGALLFPADGEGRWIVRYERGIIDARKPTWEESDADWDVDVVGTVVRFEQIVEVDDGGDVVTFEASTPSSVLLPAGSLPSGTAEPLDADVDESAWTVSGPGRARIAADRGGVRTTLLLDGFHRQDRLVADLRLRLLQLQAD
ncbi:hypothetical protein [Dactylosporangium sp. NPDC048998]|uniref:hypothetical protein n=1 Tax=Dactylosporangium sp. NPDC048998 TaxID=3363976 RepID=UPI003716E628